MVIPEFGQDLCGVLAQVGGLGVDDLGGGAKTPRRAGSGDLTDGFHVVFEDRLSVASLGMFVDLISSNHRPGRDIVPGKCGERFGSGALTHPAWFHNLVANAEVVAEYGGVYGAVPVNATAIVLEGDERDEMFAWIKDQNKTFAKYESRTDRQIPVVELRPDS